MLCVATKFCSGVPGPSACGATGLAAGRDASAGAGCAGAAAAVAALTCRPALIGDCAQSGCSGQQHESRLTLRACLAPAAWLCRVSLLVHCTLQSLQAAQSRLVSDARPVQLVLAPRAGLPALIGRL